MIVSRLEQLNEKEPLWDTVALHGCDFRPHIDGDLHNLFTTVFPLESEKETSSFILDVVKEIAEWIVANQRTFGKHDCFQVVVGWPTFVRRDSRQIVKTGGNLSQIERLLHDSASIQFRTGWSRSIFPDSE